MPKPLYEFIASPNCRPRTKRITAVVIHYTASDNLEGTVSWFKMATSKVSAHYVVGRDGHVVQMVDDTYVAFHAGRSAMHPELADGHPDKEPNVNDFSIGIELVGTANSGFTDRQLTSLYSLLELLVTKYKILPERVVGHLHIAPGRKIDPDGYEAQFNWAKTRQVAQVAYNTTVPPLAGPTPVNA